RVIAGRDRTDEDRNVLLIGQRTVVGLVLLVVLNGAVEHEQRAGQAERAAQIISKVDFRTGTTGTAREDRVAQQAQASVAAPNLLLELVDVLLEVAQADDIGRTVERRGARRRRSAGCARAGC